MPLKNTNKCNPMQPYLIPSTDYKYRSLKKHK